MGYSGVVVMYYFAYFFFQAEDGIRDGHVTGVQTCALPILAIDPANNTDPVQDMLSSEPGVVTIDVVGDVVNNFEYILEQEITYEGDTHTIEEIKIGRASCREREKKKVGEKS